MNDKVHCECWHDEEGLCCQCGGELDWDDDPFCDGDRTCKKACERCFERVECGYEACGGCDVWAVSGLPPVGVPGAAS